MMEKRLSFVVIIVAQARSRYRGASGYRAVDAKLCACNSEEPQLARPSRRLDSHRMMGGLKHVARRRDAARTGSAKTLGLLKHAACGPHTIFISG
ncbi:hypothetical protein MRX96_035895 [Rhipicephalus microplus]